MAMVIDFIFCYLTVCYGLMLFLLLSRRVRWKGFGGQLFVFLLAPIFIPIIFSVVVRDGFKQLADVERRNKEQLKRNEEWRDGKRPWRR